MSNSLQEKIALVTGGSRGIGAAIAKKLAENGATVAITYTSSSDKAAEIVADIKKAGGNALAIQADAGDATAIKNAVAQIATTFGKIDIVVNNAGLGKMAMVQDVQLEDFDRMVAVNIKGVFVTIQESLKHMTKGGRIINIGSMMSDLSLFPSASVYTMTKGAVAGLTRSLARDLAPLDITVNNVQPGPIDTDMNPANGPSSGMLTSLIPMGRYGEGKDISNLVAFLASPEAGFITGSNIHIDGGITA
jgi:3-oxoacyl-[acyl-carrier protein] reductase